MRERFVSAIIKLNDLILALSWAFLGFVIDFLLVASLVMGLVMLKTFILYKSFRMFS